MTLKLAGTYSGISETSSLSLSRKAIGARERFSEIVGKVSDNTLAPGFPLLPLHNHPPDVGVRARFAPD